MQKRRVYVHQFDGAISVGTMPLAAGQIVSAAAADPELAEAYDFVLTTDREVPQLVVEAYESPAVIALSCYPWNVQYSLALARLARQRFPECLIVVGGFGVPWRRTLAEAFLAQHESVDVLARGEGELMFRELLLAHLRGDDLAGVDGLVFRREHGSRAFVVTGPRARIADLAALPSPYLDGTFERRYQPRVPRFRALVETNRGCPFSCTFCVWGHDEQRRVYEFPLERAEAELEWVARHALQHLYIVDANFGLLRRDHDLARRLVELRARHGFPQSCYLNLTKNARQESVDIVQTIRQGGLACQVELSTQDTNAEVLAVVKRQNISAEQSLRLRRSSQALGLPTYNELILGLPQQTYESFCDTIVGAIGPFAGDAVFVYLCRLVENSELSRPEERARFGLVTRRNEMVAGNPTFRSHVPDFEEIVVGTSSLSEEDWRRAHDFGHLASVVTSMQLLDVTVRYLHFGLRLDLKAWLRRLLERGAETREAAEPSALGRLSAVLERYTTSVLGGPLLLTVEGMGPVRWQVREALYLAGLRVHAALVDEVEAETRTFLDERGLLADPELAGRIAELFRFQRFATPTFERRQAAEARFEHDWLGYQTEGAADGQVRRAPTLLRYEPPAHLASASSFAAFAGAHLGTIYSTRGQGCVTRRADA